MRTLDSVLGSPAPHEERIALVAFRNQRVEHWTRAELIDRTTRLAAGLARRGVRRGEVALLLAPNSRE